MHDWKTLLNALNEAVMTSEDMSHIAIPEYVRKMRWLGYPAATESQIVAVETGLAIKLPPSYREFLLVSNGWRKTSPFIDELYRVEDIDWLYSHSPDAIRAWTEGYGEDFEAESEEADLPRTLAVSGWATRRSLCSTQKFKAQMVNGKHGSLPTGIAPPHKNLYPSGN